MTEIFQKIKELVEKELSQTKDSAHDINHIMRVYNLAVKIAATEKNVDMDVLQAATLLHDIGGVQESKDSSGKTDHAVVGAEMAKKILEELNFSENKIKHVQSCILSHRYRTNNKAESIEAKILYDADKLDASGAIGIARAFAWVGKHGAKIYKKVDDIDAYARENLSEGKINGRIIDKSKHSVQINFETKEKFLVENLYTETAKKIGEGRMHYFKEFLDRMDKEVVGNI